MCGVRGPAEDREKSARPTEATQFILRRLLFEGVQAIQFRAIKLARLWGIRGCRWEFPLTQGGTVSTSWKVLEALQCSHEITPNGHL